MGVLTGVLAGGLGVAFAGSAAAAAPTIDCSTDPAIFNTGYNVQTGGILPNGSRDQHWQVAGPHYPMETNASRTVTEVPAALPPANATWTAAYAKHEPYWPGGTQYSDAQYVSKEAPGQTQPNVAASWYYRYDFNLAPGVSLEELSLDFYADNAVMEVWVNNTAQSSKTTGLPALTSPYPYWNAGFHEGGQASVTLGDDWRSGANSIIVQVTSAPGAEGFLARFTGEFACEPATLVDDSASTEVDTPATIDIDGNDTIPEGSTGWAVDETSTEGGTVVDNGDGTVTYTPPAGFTGTDTFTYRVTGPDGVEVEATVTVTVTEGEEPPVPALSLTGAALALVGAGALRLRRRMTA
ncbi:Ig-like domain-containing protein [Promicromonospora sp. NPDC050262]|uniref:Ig-like domain-containing protein n=1 Tax=Promicromonospora sp. NPDC050262 TaxID=3155036 RepID=UPI0033E93F0E